MSSKIKSDRKNVPNKVQLKSPTSNPGDDELGDEESISRPISHTTTRNVS